MGIYRQFGEPSIDALTMSVRAGRARARSLAHSHTFDAPVFIQCGNVLPRIQRGPIVGKGFAPEFLSATVYVSSRDHPRFVPMNIPCPAARAGVISYTRGNPLHLTLRHAQSF